MDLDAFFASVARINATPVPIGIRKDRGKPSPDGNPRPTTAGYRALFLAGDLPPHCCAQKPHQPHRWGLYGEWSCDGTPLPRRIEPRAA